jgi:hypothetical protein
MFDLLSYSEPVLRVTLFLTGAWVAGHYLCAGNFLKKAPHYIKALLMPCTVVSGVGMSWAAWHHGSGVAMLFSVPAVICMSISEASVWRAGAYISAAFDLQENIKEASARSLRMSLRLAKDGVSYVTEGIVTDSGLQELQAAEQRAKENT